MSIVRNLILIIFCVSCKTQDYKIYQKAKAQNDKRLELIKNLEDPFSNKVNDSMKKWIPIFKTVYINDQKNRLVGYGFTKEGLKEQKKLDSLNLTIVTNYLDKFNWPTFYDVGFFGQKAIGLTIQHASLEVQEKYYPNLVEAYKKDSRLFETLALLEDRINARKHRFQFYGTQLTYYKGKQVMYPVYNIDSLETWRKRIGFKTTLESYLKILKTEWNINDYKNILPDLINELKVTDSVGIHFSF